MSENFLPVQHFSVSELFLLEQSLEQMQKQIDTFTKDYFYLVSPDTKISLLADQICALKEKVHNYADESFGTVNQDLAEAWQAVFRNFD